VNMLGIPQIADASPLAELTSVIPRRGNIGERSFRCWGWLPLKIGDQVAGVSKEARAADRGKRKKDTPSVDTAWKAEFPRGKGEKKGRPIVSVKEENEA